MNHRDDSRNTSRRNFVKYFLIGSLTTGVGASLFKLNEYLTPPKAAKTALPKKVDLKKRADKIQSNSAVFFAYGDRPAMLIKLKSGKFRAFFATCTHLACTVEYRPDTERIVCACHDGVFDLDGKNIDGPPPSPLIRLSVRADSKGHIEVRT